MRGRARPHGSTEQTLLAALLGVSCGLALARVAGETGFAPGTAVLVAAAITVRRSRRWWAPIAAVAAVAFVLLNQFGDGVQTLRLPTENAVASVGDWLVLIASALALVCAVWSVTLRRRNRPVAGPRARPAPRRYTRSLGLVAALLVLSPICAEDLAAYDNTTGRPAQLLAGVVLFGFLYGAPALLIRELARRTGRGWPAILLLATAAGVVQAGLVDQSMFNDSYRDIPTWGDLFEPTRIEALGLSAFAAQSFVVGHIAYSFCAPIALVEAMRPASARQSWVGRRGLAVVAALYLVAAGLVLWDTQTNEPAHLSIPQIAGTVAVVGALVVAAWRSRPLSPSSVRAVPRAWIVLAVSLGLATALAILPSTWLGVALSALVLLIAGFLLLRFSRRAGWGVHHAAAVAGGAVLSRGLLAFFYYPVIGEVSAARKYSHNVVMLLVVGIAITLALVRSRRTEAARVAL